MPTSTKKTPTRRPAAPRARPVARAKAAAPRVKAASRQPFIRFYISTALRAETEAVLTTVENSRKAGEHRGALVDTVVALSDAGTSYYFLRPLKLAKANFAVEQLAKLSMGANQRLVASAIRTVMGRMDDRQLVFVCRYIRQLMR
jgi:hypothetical protein